MKPFPKVFDFWGITVFIHERFGTKGLKTFWLSVAIAGIVTDVFMVFFIWWVTKPINN